MVVASGCALLAISCAGVAELKAPEYSTSLAPGETRLSAFKDLFPEQYRLYARNNLSDLDTMTEYGGAVNFDKNNDQDPLPEGYRNAQPYLKALWLGYPFSYEYRAARGHSLAVRDILHIDRINRYGDGKGQLPATCWTCKTPNIPRWVEEQSDAKFWSSEFNRYRTAQRIDMEDESINCANCHDPRTMELRIISAALKDALVRRDPDWSWEKTSRNEKRTLVCAQCHVEYYFTPANQGVAAKPVYPWDKGRDPEQIYAYYDEHGPASAPKGFEGKFYDWVHPVSGVC
jgi:nitrite reductase (cytochrome c-552)